MSFFATLEKDFSTFFHKSPTFIHYTLAFVNFAAPIAEGLEAFLAPGAIPATIAIVARIQTGLTVAYALANEGNASGATLASTLAVLQTDLAQLESVAGIKDPATIAKIATLLAEIEQIAALIPNPANAVPTASTAA